jgi:hypothetical protein
MGDILVTVKINTDKNTKHTRQRTLRPFGAWAGGRYIVFRCNKCPPTIGPSGMPTGSRLFMVWAERWLEDEPCV